MERRVFIAVILSFLVLYGYQACSFRRRRLRQQPAGAAAAPRRAASSGSRAPTPTAPAAPPPPAAPEPAGARRREPTEREIVVDTATVQARLTNRGGALVHWRLKDYRDDQGEPVDLVPSALPADQPTPVLAAGGRSRRSRAAEHRALPGDRRHDGRVERARRTRAGVRVRGRAGLRARKEFRFEPRELRRHVLGVGRRRMGAR